MRGHDEQTQHMFSHLSPEQRVPADHPLRAVRALTDHALKTMSRRWYAKTERPKKKASCRRERSASFAVGSTPSHEPRDAPRGCAP